MKNYFDKNDEENFESMDSTFTPIGRADSRTRRFQEVKELKSKIKESKISGSRRIEVEDSRSQRLKKSKISRSRSYMKLKIEAFEDR
jgi:hypothetical protein